MKKKVENRNENKRSKSKTIFAILAVLIVVLIGIFLLISNWYNYAIYNPKTNITEVDFKVEPGDTLVSIADSLEEAGIIKSKDALKIYLRLNSVDAVIKTGDYTFSGDIAIPKLIEVLEAGTFKPSTSITVQEGLLTEDVAEIFDSELTTAGENKKFKSSEFLDIVANPNGYDLSEEVANFLSVAKPSSKPLDGYLFPDTYSVDSEATAQDIVEMMVLNLKKRLEENQINVSGIKNNQEELSNFYEVLILASIIEREAGKNDDPSIISSVFHNRLATNYPLQADSTVNYVTGKNDAGALIADTKIDSPYNTYKYAGLTPTPINNPGIRSIKASLTPSDTKYFFFWHSSTGQVYFAVTYEQHQANIRKYP